MAQSSASLFEKHKYITIETYRKSGDAVRTPVWFAQEGDMLYVFTFGNSGKAKRIRRNSQVKLAPSNRTGKPLGAFVDGQAEVHEKNSAIFPHGNQLLRQKYGLMKRIFEWMGRGNAAGQVVISIRLAQ